MFVLRWFKEYRAIPVPDVLMNSTTTSDFFLPWTIVFPSFNPVIYCFDMIEARGRQQEAHPDSDTSGWLISTLGAHLRATNPKDHIYGLLGLSGIALCPDYSDSVPVAQVYRYYVEKSLARSPSSDSLPLLFFLFHSGIGLFPDQAINQAP